MGEERRAARRLPVEDSAGPLGFRFSCGAAGEALRIRRAAPTLLLPLGASLLEVREARGAPVMVDRTSWFVVPGGSAAQVGAVSAVYELLELVPSPALLTAAARAYRGEVKAVELRRYLAEGGALPRTVWVHELAHRYLFERVVCRKAGTLAARFLEVELVKELYFLARERAQVPEVAGGARAGAVTRSAPVERALAHLEQHLFEPFTVADLARRAGASPSTLLRAFRREVQASPAAYVRTRRLDEAMVLLRTGRYGVGETALRVGYGNLAAFTAAFHKRFGAAPSRVRPAAP